MNEASNLQLFINLSVSHHPGCHTVCFASTGWWSTGNTQAHTRNYGAQVRKCLLSRFTWTAPRSRAGINWQHQHWQHPAQGQWLRFCWEGMCSRGSSTSLSRSHGAGLTQVAAQSSTADWHCSVLSHCGNLPRHRARRSHGKTALLSRTWLINATGLWSYTAAFSELWSATQEYGSYFQVTCTYSNSWFLWISVPNNVWEVLKPFSPF